MQGTRERIPSVRIPSTATWGDVRRWAANAGLTSADALSRWLDDITPDRVPRLDPYETALLRAFQQYALAVQPDGSLPAPWRLMPLYRPALAALDDPVVRAQLDEAGSAVQMPGTTAGAWTEPLIDPLAPGADLLWPPSPVTATAHIAQTVHRAFGYRPPDVRALILSLATEGARGPAQRRAVGDDVGAQLRTLNASIERALDDLLGLQVDPYAPPLAPIGEVDQARTRWPSITPDRIEPPYMIVVGSGLFRGAPTHVVWLRSGPGAVAGVVVDDSTGRVVDVDGATAEDVPNVGFGVYAPDVHRAIAQASGGQSSVVADFLADFARAARDGRLDAAGLVPIAPSDSPIVGWIDNDIERVDYGRVVEPAEVLAALSIGARRRAVKDMQQALASISGLTRRASEAYQGNLSQANVPEELRQLLAVQAASRACMPGADVRQRRLVLDAAAVLGVPVASESTIESLCAASAQAAERLYGAPQS
nr:hypothetical protein [Pandoravirus massiliensis]